MTNVSSRQALQQQLADELGTAGAETLVTRLYQAIDRPDGAAQLLTLLSELYELSQKTACAAITALPELDRRAGLSHVHLWLDLGIALTESSGAAALKYFKDSPLVLGLIEQPADRSAVLTVGLEIAEHDANVALEYIRQAPQILSAVPSGQLRPWLDIGLELTQVNVVVGLEFIRHIHTLASVLPLEKIRDWAAIGMKLIVPNSLGKPDYVAIQPSVPGLCRCASF
jgi:nitric oxide reductase NorD protein